MPSKAIFMPPLLDTLNLVHMRRRPLSWFIQSSGEFDMTGLLHMRTKTIDISL